MSGYSSISRPSLSGGVNIRANYVKTDTLVAKKVSGGLTGSTYVSTANIYFSGTCTGPTGSFNSLKSANSVLTSIYNTSLTGTTLYEANINYSGSLAGPTGSFTNLKATSSELTNVYNTSMTGTTLYEANVNYSGNLIGPTGSFTNLKATNSELTNVYNTSMTGTTLHETNIYVIDSVAGPTGNFTTLSTANVVVSGTIASFSSLPTLTSSHIGYRTTVNPSNAVNFNGSGTVVNICSVTLPVGVWSITGYGYMACNSGSTTTMTNVAVGLQASNSAMNSSPPTTVFFNSAVQDIVGASTDSYPCVSVSTIRVLNANTTIYLNGLPVYSGGTSPRFGTGSGIVAVRIA